MDPISWAMLAVLAVVHLLLLFLRRRSKTLPSSLQSLLGLMAKSESVEPQPPPRPWTLPIIGNMVQLGMKPNPYECMTDISHSLGPVFGLRLGSSDVVVVNDMKSILEVLVHKGDHFDGRPNFSRYNELFGGDRDNSLALCDWSKKQVSRRNVARRFMHVRPGTDAFQMLNSSIMAEMPALEQKLDEHAGQPLAFKQVIQRMCFNVFSDYLCSRKFAQEDPKFQKLVRNFDEIFWDINLGYAMDFIDWLKVFRLNLLSNLRKLSGDIRAFINDEIIEHHKKDVDYDNPRDFVDMLLKRMKFEQGDHETISEVTALYELEDFLGGHSAVGNIIMQGITQIARNPDVMRKIQEEIDQHIGDRHMNIEDRASLPYTESSMYEALRVASSPIVPHVASRDSTIGGFLVRRGDVVFINNYELNMSPQYWSEPQRFDPARFVKKGAVVKPPHFLPFSTGKRSCMGSKMLTNVTFLTIATILSKFDVLLPDDARNTRMMNEHMCSGRLALPVDSFSLIFKRRQRV